MTCDSCNYQRPWYLLFSPYGEIYNFPNWQHAIVAIIKGRQIRSFHNWQHVVVAIIKGHDNCCFHHIVKFIVFTIDAFYERGDLISYQVMEASVKAIIHFEVYSLSCCVVWVMWQKNNTTEILKNIMWLMD